MTSEITLKTFSNENFENIAVTILSDKEWFKAVDIAKMLGYRNPKKAITDHCLKEGVTICSLLTDGGSQKAKFINEGNLYRLIIKSKLPTAQKFERWIFDEVLPSIRKTGSYSTFAVPTSLPEALRLAA